MLGTAIGIDQSYSGCAIVAYDAVEGTAEHWTYDFSPKVAGTGIARLLYVRRVLRERLSEIAWQEQVTHVAYEGYAYGARFRREELGELGCCLKLALADVFPAHLTSRVHAVAPSSVKKFATGSGRAPKDKMMLAVFQRWGFEPASNDVADAYTLARIADALAAVEPPELKFQREVLATVRKDAPTEDAA